MRAGPALTSSTWLALAYVAVLGYLDWITHRSATETIVMCLCVAAVVVYRGTIVKALNLGPTLAAIPAGVKAALAAVPALIYFLVRGQGTSDSGAVVFLSLAVVVAANAIFGRALDRKLAGFYRARNRVLPQPLRIALAIVAPVLVAFLVIHGSLTDLPAMFGGTTHHPKTPAGHEGAFFLGTLLSAAVAWLLLREGPGPGWRPTHTTPAGGLTAWAQPAPDAPSQYLPGGLGLQVVARHGDWVRVRSDSGWTGWLDGRRLESVGRRR